MQAAAPCSAGMRLALYGTPEHADLDTSHSLMGCCCRQALASNLRKQILEFREEETGDKSAMPSYGTVVRYTTACNPVLPLLHGR